MTKKRIDTTLHYVQYVGARIMFVVVVGFLLYNIWIQRTSAIIFCCLFLIYMLFLLKKVFNKPTEIEFDENFIYLQDGEKRIELNQIIRIKGRRIFYESNGVESSIKLPNFHFMDKKWIGLKNLINNKNL